MFYYGTRLSENISRRPEGYLLCLNVPVARTGSQDYIPEELGLPAPSPGPPVIPVYRPESEVFSPETIASFEGMPVTNDHPPDGVSIDNIRARDLWKENNPAHTSSLPMVTPWPCATNWLGTEIATEAGEGDELSLALAEDAVPEAGNYFTGEFTVNGFSLGRQSEGLASWPVRDFFMPAYPVTVGAVQALRERLELDFAPGETCMAPFEAVQQMMISEATEELFVIDENGQTLIDLFGDGTAVLSVAN